MPESNGSMTGGDTDAGYGCKPEQRSIEQLISKGVVNLDKPKGPSSHQISSWIKSMLNVKTGHGGTLDPGVTGTLPIFLGTATRLADILLSSDKEYICLMRLHKKIPKKKLMSTFSMFQGDIYQKPPVKSAVKRVSRKRKVYDVEVLEVEENEILFKISCEAGTYVRKYCHDFGLMAGVNAHMQELRRLKSGVFTEENIITLQELKDAYVFWKENGEEKYLRRCILPIEYAVSDLPKISIRDTAVDSICHGSDLASTGIVSSDEFGKGCRVAVMTMKGELVALGEALEDNESITNPKLGFVVKTDKVFMDPGTYPKAWKRV